MPRWFELFGISEQFASGALFSCLKSVPVPHPSRKKRPSRQIPHSHQTPHSPPTSTNTTTTTNNQITQIYEGTNQICRMVAGRQILADAQKR
ncbi:hypothetical protein F6I42_03610 [Corynebacterium amycolatum]|nr:hypothetical protein F6I42_03610 [Corynebacterium amycolatum]